MHRITFLWASMLTLALSSQVFAQDASLNNNILQNDSATAEPVDESAPAESSIDNESSSSTPKHPRLEALKELRSLKADQLKVDANAAQADEIKDPLQPLNRQIYEFNDALDRNVARPLAVQYTEKVPTEVRGSYRNFRKNLGEPWNAVNQLAQGRFVRAAKTLGRFTVNTVTTLGFADPAQRLGLSTEDENFGTTLGYFGIPSGPYVVLPIFGPSTFRDSLGQIADSQARPQKYILDGHDRLYYSEQTLRGIDARSQFLDLDNVLQGDKYAAMRDAYLQNKKFKIAEKKGLESDSDLFISDDSEINDAITK